MGYIIKSIEMDEPYQKDKSVPFTRKKHFTNIHWYDEFWCRGIQNILLEIKNTIFTYTYWNGKGQNTTAAQTIQDTLPAKIIGTTWHVCHILKQTPTQPRVKDLDANAPTAINRMS